MRGRTRMGSWSILHTFILLFFLLDHHTGCSARMWRTISEIEEVAEVVHSSYLSNLHRRQLQTLAYCIAISTADQTQLQTALDWACSSSGGNVDCSPLQVGGTCYNPNTLFDHASYAFNQYYINQNAASGSCSFNGVATPSSTKPTSTSSTCNFPAYGGSTSTTNGTTSSTPPPSTSNTNTTFSPPSTGTTFDNGTTSGTTNFATPSLIPPTWLHALCSGILLILFIKL